MLGAVLLYVGFVLIINGVGRLTKIDPKSVAIMNLLTGGLSVIVNIGSLIVAQIQSPNNAMAFYPAATGLLFGFTYIFIALDPIFNIDTRVFAWYSLFVAVTTIPAGILSWNQGGIYNQLMGIIWWAWGVLWITAWIEIVAKKNLKNFVPWLSIVEGIFTAWIPGFLILMGIWT